MSRVRTLLWDLGRPPAAVVVLAFMTVVCAYGQDPARPQALMERAGDLTVTLTAFVTGDHTPVARGESDTDWTRISFLLAQKGRPVPPGQWGVWKLTLRDAAGKTQEQPKGTRTRLSFDSSGRGVETTMNSPALPGKQQDWKLRLQLYRTSAAAFSPEERAVVTGIDLPLPGGAGPLELSVARAEGTLRLESIAADRAAPDATNPRVHYKLAVRWLPSAPASAGPDAPWDGLLLTTLSAAYTRSQEDRPALAQVVPEQDLPLVGSVSHIIDLMLPEEARRVELALAFQKCRTVEFEVRPTHP